VLKDRIKHNLAAVTHLTIDDKTLKRAAVVIAIADTSAINGSPCFLLTLRASKLRAHAGQFALPGGKLDDGENAEQAALRELHEELGVNVSHNNILGVLDDYPTRSGFSITPVVVWLGHLDEISPNPNEVAKVFHIPLEDLSREDLVNLKPGKSDEQPVFSINIETIGHEIYAPTAAIIYQFHEMAIKQKQTRVAFYDEPTFAWK